MDHCFGDASPPLTPVCSDGACDRAILDAVLGPTRRSLWLLFGAVALVLIAACANVANLLLALTSSRMQEVATRAALGASSARLVRQFMIESLLLALAGGLAGVLVARWTSNLLIAFGSERIPRMHEVAFDWTVFAFLLLVCVATALFFGVAPALAAGRVDAGIPPGPGARPPARYAVARRAGCAEWRSRSCSPAAPPRDQRNERLRESDNAWDGQCRDVSSWAHDAGIESQSLRDCRRVAQFQVCRPRIHAVAAASKLGLVSNSTDSR